jgi:hypothetical protein
MTLFTVIWWAAVALQLYFGAPILFPIVSGLFGILITFMALELWLRVSRINVNGRALTVASGYLTPGRERTLTADEITDVVTAVGMQAGKTVYYDEAISRTLARRGSQIPARHGRAHVLC